MNEEADVIDFGRPFEELRAKATQEQRQLYAQLNQELGRLYGPRLLSVKLVGSRARGTATESSDYDFLVFLDVCDYSVEVPALARLAEELEGRCGLGPLSISPMTREQFLGLDAKYDGITDNFRRDAVALWP